MTNFGAAALGGGGGVTPNWALKILLYALEGRTNFKTPYTTSNMLNCERKSVLRIIRGSKIGQHICDRKFG